jgi:(p)ppGpp synthase/HD superfamily hydrolase
MHFSELVERAIELAAEWHDQTYRKSRWRESAFEAPAGVGPARVPVIAHVTAVALTVQRAGWDDATVAAAFLHDILEDRNRYGDHLNEQSLRTLVGDEVTDRVLGVTEPQFGEDGEPLPWRFRKDTYLERLQQAAGESVAISLADKLHNAWTMSRGLEAGFDIFRPAAGRRALSAGPAEQLWFYNAVLAIADRRGDSRLATMRSELAAEVDRFARLAGLRED